MSTRQKRQSRISGLIIPALCAAILGYFAYHAQNGRYSIHTQAEMDQEALRLQFALTDLIHQRAVMERKVRQLTSGTLEKDALDEVARSQLGYAAPGELTIFYN